MSWTDRLIPASYRGVPFFVDSTDYEGGRAQIVHSFPYSDKHFVEDVGREPRRFNVTGYIIGDDFLYLRDKFIRAAERRPLRWPYSAGQDLRLPSFGILSVHLSRFRVRETRKAGRIITFEAEFVEAGEIDEPSKAKNRAALSATSADALEISAGAALTGELVTEGIGIGESIREATASAISFVGGAMSGLSTIRGAVKEVEAFQRDVSNFVDQAAALATAPLDLVNGLIAAYDGIILAAGNFSDSLFAYEELLGIDLDGLKGGASSSSGIAANKNVTLVSQLAREVAAAGALRSIAGIDFESSNEAEERRDRLKASINAILPTASYQTYSDLQDACQVLVEVIPGDDESLPRIETLRLKSTEPTLVVAQRLYGDAARATEIALRNRVRRPGFVPAAEPLEVLSS